MPFYFPKLIYGLSTKIDGPMKLELPSPSFSVLENRKRYFEKCGINPENVVSAQIVHGTRIAVVSNKNKGQVIEGVDGLITDEITLFLSVTIADCVPIYFYDDVKKVVGIAHAGWRGIVGNIVKSMIESFVNEFNSNTEDIVAYVGPHIQKCHFEIKEDIVDNFDSEFVLRENGIIKVDLLSMIKKQLLSLGLCKENIDSSEECTHCKSEKYYSFRRDKPEKVEAMVGVIGMK